MIRIYSAFFLPDGKHITWEFNPGKCKLPEGLEEGKEVAVKVIGEYKDAEISALQVEVMVGERVFTHQSSGTPLHITLEAAKGVAPVQSGIRIAEFGATPIKPYTIKAKAGFFKAPPRD